MRVDDAQIMTETTHPASHHAPQSGAAAHNEGRSPQSVTVAKPVADPSTTFTSRFSFARTSQKKSTSFRPYINTDSLAPAGKHFPDNPKPSDHLRLLHGSKSVAGRSVGLRLLGDLKSQPETRFKAAQKPSVFKLLFSIDELIGRERVYLTQASYIWGKTEDKNRFRTTSEYLSDIRVVFVDLDIYSVPEFIGVSAEAVAQKVLDTCRAANIPDPLIISSGRGLYTYWVLDKRLKVGKVYPDNVRNWKNVQNKLMGLLSRFGADSKVSDLTRVLRLVGTVNEKTGTAVRVIHDDGKRFNLGSLCAATADLPAYVPVKVSACHKDKKSKCGKSNQNKETLLETKCKKSLPVLTTAATQNSIADGLQMLQALIESDTAVADKLPRMRKNAWRMFKDIAQVVIKRGGLKRGERDEFQFWLLTTRFNAGLFEAHELPIIAEQFSRFAEGGMNLWGSGLLSSLHQRMTRQTRENGPVCGVRLLNRSIPHLHKKVTIGYLSFNPISTHRPYGYGSQYASPRVYTPSVATLITKLGITEEEQQSLDILIGPQEKQRRRSLKNVRHQKIARNEQLCKAHEEAYAVGKPDVASLAKAHGVSASSAYRILAQSNDKPSTTLKDTVVDLWKNNPDLSLRAIARQTNAPLTSVSRWVKGHTRIQQPQTPAIPEELFLAGVPAPVPVEGVPLSYFPFVSISIEERYCDNRSAHATRLHAETPLDAISHARNPYRQDGIKTCQMDVIWKDMFWEEEVQVQNVAVYVNDDSSMDNGIIKFMQTYDKKISHLIMFLQ